MFLYFYTLCVQKGGGVCSVVYKDGMTRAPVVEFPNIQQAV